MGKPLTSRELKERRVFWQSLGFCPSCLHRLDTFPATNCSECKFKTKIRDNKECPASATNATDLDVTSVTT